MLQVFGCWVVALALGGAIVEWGSGLPTVLNVALAALAAWWLLVMPIIVIHEDEDEEG